MIDTKTFFIFGIICFTIIGICQILNLIIFFGGFNIFAIVISVFQALFSLVTAAFFYYMYKTMTPSTETGFLDEKKLKENLEAFEKI